jgi:uncharacterized repeat protein (TIGR01451 family)
MYIYAIQRGSGNLLRIGQDGEVTSLGAVSGTGWPNNTTIAGNGAFNSGDFGDETCALADCQDILFVRLGSNSTPYTQRLWAININTLVATTINLSQVVPNTSDMVFSEGYLWAVNGNVTGANATIYRINPSSGQINTFTLPTVAGAAITTNGIIRQAYGAQWKYGNGDLGISGNDTGVAYHIKVTNASGATPSFKIMSAFPAPNSSNNDGASYAGVPIDLSITKEASSSTYVPGGTLSYTFTVTNNSQWYSSGSIVTDILPAELLNPVTTLSECSISSNVLTCALGALPGGGVAVITVEGTVSANANAPISNTVIVAGNEKDNNPSNDTSTVFTYPEGPVVGITKTADVTRVAPGGTITYQIRVDNAGNVAAANVVVSDPVPASVDSVVWACAGAACPTASGADAINDTLLSLAVGDAVVYTVTAMVSDSPPASVVNIAEVTVPNGVCVQDECTASASVITERSAPRSTDAHIPALSWWSLLGLMALLAGVAARRRRCM